MTDRAGPGRPRFLGPYVQRVARLMGLTHWTIKLSDKPADPGNAASVRPVHGRYVGIVYLGDLFFAEETPAEQRDTIAHEMLHLHLAQLDAIAAENLPPEIYKHFDRTLEYAIDGMAKAWSSLLPMPPQPKTRG